MTTRLVFVLLLGGCGAKSRRLLPGPDAGTDADSDVDVDVDVDSDADTDTGKTDAGTEGVCLARSERPAEGAVGEACEIEGDCERGLDCSDWTDGYCSRDCGPRPEVCPQSSTCIEWYSPELLGVESVCLDTCVVSERNDWLQSACGCRRGYQCQLSHEVCVPGCDAEDPSRDCCEEFDLLPPDSKLRREDCTETCLDASSRCLNPGTAEAEVGDTCVVDQECPQHGRCIRFGEPGNASGGLCVLPDCGGSPLEEACLDAPRATCVRTLDFVRPDSGWCLEACSVSMGGGSDACLRTDFTCVPLGDGGSGFCFPDCRERGGDEFCVAQGWGDDCRSDGVCG